MNLTIIIARAKPTKRVTKAKRTGGKKAPKTKVIKKRAPKVVTNGDQQASASPVKPVAKKAARKAKKGGKKRVSKKKTTKRVAKK